MLSAADVDFCDFMEAATWAKYWMTFLVFSVFPAPDSPLEKQNMGGGGDVKELCMDLHISWSRKM